MSVSRPIRLRSFDCDATHGELFHLNKSMVTLGRDESCDITIEDGKTSRVHCEIMAEGGFNVLIDRHSTNGTYVNNGRIVHHVLEVGDILQVGSTRMLVERTSAQAPDEEAWDDQTNSEILVSLPLNEVQQRVTHYAQTGDSGMFAPGLTPVAPDAGAKYEKNTDDDSAPNRLMVSAEVFKRRSGDSSLNLKASDLAADELRILYRVADRLNRLVSHEELYDFVSEMIFEIFPAAEYFTLTVKNQDAPEGPQFNPVRSCLHSSKNQKQVFPISRSLVQSAIESRSGLLTGANDAHEQFEKSESITRLRIRGAMCAPMISADAAIGILYVDNRTRDGSFTQTDLELFTALASQFAVVLDKLLMSFRLNRTFHETLLALVNALEAKDHYTMGHTQRVCQYALGIARALGLTPADCSDLQTAAMLHDIGKVGIRNNILNKSGALSETEFVSIKNHVEMGCFILKPIAYLRHIIPTIRSHHERWDGKGYPDGLQGEAIPLGGRILALADALDAMTSQRTYNEPLTKEEAMQRVREGAGTHFDPAIVDALEKHMEQFDLISKESTFIRKIEKPLDLHDPAAPMGPVIHSLEPTISGLGESDSDKSPIPEADCEKISAVSVNDSIDEIEEFDDI